MKEGTEKVPSMLDATCSSYNPLPHPNTDDANPLLQREVHNVEIHSGKSLHPLPWNNPSFPLRHCLSGYRTRKDDSPVRRANAPQPNYQLLLKVKQLCSLFSFKPYDQQMKQIADWDEVPFLNIPDGTVHLHTNDRMEPQQSPPGHYRD